MDSPPTPFSYNQDDMETLGWIWDIVKSAKSVDIDIDVRY